MRLGKYKRPRQPLTAVLAGADFIRSLDSLFNATAQRITADTSHHEPDPSQQICHLNKLPPELRITIYEYALSKRKTIKFFKRPQIVHKGPALLVVSKEVRREALPVYFKCNTFIVEAALSKFGGVGRWMERIGERCGRQAFLGFSFYVIERSSWNDYSRMWKLVRLLACGKIELDTSAIDLQAEAPQRGHSKTQSLFHLSRAMTGYYIQVGLEEAVLLGAKARREGWNSSTLWLEFEALHNRRVNSARNFQTRMKQKRAVAKQQHDGNE